MITCAQCGKKNKDDATVCKHCGYNPTALSAAAWGYQNTAYPAVTYPNNTPTAQYYYDEKGTPYKVKYDYVVTPVDADDDDDDEDEDDGFEKTTLYPYNPTMVQTNVNQTPIEKKNAMAWIGYFLAMFIDILAWPFCWIGLAIAGKRDGSNKEVCEAGMLFTLMRLVSAIFLFLVWWGVSSFLPQFFVGAETWKVALVKIVMFGWPVVVGSIFVSCAAEGTALRLAGKGFFYFSIALALAGVIFFDVTWLPIFS